MSRAVIPPSRLCLSFPKTEGNSMVAPRGLQKDGIDNLFRTNKELGEENKSSPFFLIIRHKDINQQWWLHKIFAQDAQMTFQTDIFVLLSPKYKNPAWKVVWWLCPAELDGYNKQLEEKSFDFSSNCDSEAIRTLDPRLRRALLYPAELRNLPI